MRKLLFLLLAAVFVAAADVVPDLYIVELSGEPAAAKGSRAALADQRAAVQAAQADVRTRLAAAVPEAQTLTAVDTVANALIVRVPDSEIGRVSAVPGVARVYPVHEVRLELDHALPLHKVPDAWRQLGGEDRAGLGVKVGIIDTGIDVSHPGLQDSSLEIPAGFPKVNDELHLEFTNKKVIVARGYGSLLSGDSSLTPADRVGHGTAVAMAAAGVRNTGPLGTITGVAPKAFIGNYNVFDSSGRSTRSDVVLKAIDDAVADKMDVINLSLGIEPAMRPEADVLVSAIERAAGVGVVVVKSAGNNGGTPDRATPASISSPGTAPSVLTVGASFNDRFFFTAIRVESIGSIIAFAGNGPEPDEPISAPLVDAAKFDPTGLACTKLPDGSLTGNIVLILRGECTFEVKLNNAQAAGAVGAVVYTSALQPTSLMDVQGATLPGMMIAHADGLRLKKVLEQASPMTTLVFDFEPLPLESNELASFSAKGPSSDNGVKPDLAAVGIEISTAAQASFPDGELFSSSGYALVDGTSFSSPLAAGAVALLRGARQNLTVPQLRSLIINSATPLVLASGQTASVQHAGSGVLNVDAALANTTVAEPASISFGTGGGTVDLSREITVMNLGTASDTFSISIQPHGDRPAPVASAVTMDIAAGQSGKFQLAFNGSGLEPGEYQGFAVIRGARSAIETRIPYWYAVPSKVPAAITFLNPPSTGAPESTVRVQLRVTDTFGIPIPDADIRVTALAGGGSMVSVESVDATYPGVYLVRLRLGLTSGNNRFRFEAGDIGENLTITGAGL
jgi:subtilisin family serine protease